MTESGFLPGNQHAGKAVRRIFLLCLWLAAPFACATELDELLCGYDPFQTIAVEELEALVQQLERLQSSATPSQQWSIELFRMRYLTIRGQFEAALVLLQQLDQPAVPPAYRVRAYSIALPIYRIRGDYVSAFTYLNKMQRLLPQIRNLQLQFIASSMAPSLYMDAGNLDKALRFVKDSLKLAKRTNSRANICTAALDVANVYLVRKEPQQTETAYQNALAACRITGDHLFICMAHSGYGEFLLHQKRYQEVAGHLNMAVVLCGRTKYQFGVVSSQSGLAQLYFEQGEYARAEQKLTAVIPQLEALDVKDHLVDSYHLMALLREREGKVEQALAWYKKQWAEEKAIIDSRKAVSIAQLTVDFELKSKEQHILQLTHENQLLLLQKKNAYQNTVIVILGLVVVMLVGLLLWFRTRQERRYFQRMSQVDGLTRLYNQAHCCTLAEKPFEEHRRSRKPFSVVVADIDWFKQVNDTFGHAAGDKVLQEIGRVLKTCMAEYGIVGRTGGEEFTCFFPGLTALETRDLLQSCGKHIQPVLDEGRRIEVTLSYGIAQSSGEYAILGELVRDADSALYRAKRSGRNRIVVYKQKDTVPPCTEEKC